MAEDELILRGSTLAPQPADPLLARPDPTWAETGAAALRQTNPLVSVLTALSGRSGSDLYDPAFNPLNEPGFKGSKFEQRYFDRFVMSPNREAMQAEMARIEREERDRQTLEDAGGWGTAAAVGAGLLDPTLFLPAGGVVRAASGGLSIARSAALVGGLAGLQAGVSEAALQLSQATRPMSESVINVATGTLLGAILGGGAAALLSRGERRALEGLLERDRMDLTAPEMRPPGGAVPASEGPLLGFGSAAGADVRDKRQLILARFTPAWIDNFVPPAFREKAGEWLLQHSPTARVFMSGNVEAKRAMADLVETAFRFEDNAQGITTALEGRTVDRMVRWAKSGFLLDASDELKNAFALYRYGENAPRYPAAQATFDDMRGTAGGKISFADFKGEVTRALMSNDEHAVPEVQRAARYIRSKILSPTEKWLQEIGLLGEEVGAKGDPTWFARLPNREQIAAGRDRLRATFADWLEEEQGRKAGIKDRLTTSLGARTDLEAQIARLDAVLERLSTSEAKVEGALRERASDVKRLDKRVDTLTDRVDLLKAEDADLVEFIKTMKATVRDPATIARLDELEREARILRQEEDRVTPGLRDLVEMEHRQAEEILKDEELDLAAKILTGKRKAYKPPSFAKWIADRGGVVDRGGELRHALGGSKTIPGLIRRAREEGGMFGGSRRRGRELADIAQDIVGNTESRLFTDREVTPDEVLGWIVESLNGREPDWWLTMHGGNAELGSTGARIGGDVSVHASATRLAEILQESLDRAGTDVTRNDIAKLVTGQQGRLRFEEVDEALARMQDLADQTSIRRTAVEDEIAFTREQIAEARTAIDRARQRRETVGRGVSREGARLSEAEMAARPARTRFDILRDRATLLDIKRDITNEAIALAQKQADDLRARMEGDLRDWKGKSASEAVAALKARDKAAGEGARIAGRMDEADAAFARMAEVAGDDVAGRLASPYYPEPGRVRAGRDRSADDAVDRAVSRIVASDRDWSRGELEGRADEWINRWMSGPDGRLPYDAHNGEVRLGPPSNDPPPRGSLHPREAAIPTVRIWDFVEHDVEHLLDRVLSTVLPDGMIHERFGDVEMRNVFRKVDDDSSARAAAAATDAERTAIEKERQSLIEDLAASRDRVRNIYGFSPDPMMNRAATWARRASRYNIITDLGTAMLNSMGDMAGTIFRYGLVNTFRDGWMPYVASLVSGGEFKGSAQRQAKAAMIAVETALNLRAHALGDVLDNFRPGNKFDRGLAWAADKSQLVNGQAWFTDTVKTIAATVAGADMLRAMERVAGGTASQKEIADLAARNISQYDARAIWNEFSNGGGEKIKGVRIANTADWKDARLRQVFQGALAREADIAVVTPGAEKPLWMSRPVASLLGQFKSFVAGAHERTVLAQMQQRDGRTLAGLVSAVALGVLSYRLYTAVSGQKFEAEPSQLVKEGLSRSGVLGWVDEANAISSKVTRGQGDLYRLIGADKPLSRYQSRSILAALLGPTAGKIEGTAVSLGGIASGDFTAGDTTRLRRLIPFQNLFFVRGLFNEAEEGFNALWGVPQKPAQGASGTPF